MVSKKVFIYALLCGIFYCIGIGSAKDKKLPQKYSSTEIRNIAMTALNKSEDDLEGMIDYVFSEVEKFIVYDMKTNEITTKYDKSYVPSFVKEYVWFLREGFLVRSPTLVDGVSIAPAVKTAAEEAWLKKEKRNGKWRSFYDYIYDCFAVVWQEIQKNPMDLGKPGHEFAGGDYFYLGEKEFEGHKIIEIQFVPIDDHRPNPGSCVVSIIPEENQVIKFQDISHYVKDEMIMAKQDNKIWLPKKYSYMYLDYAAKRRYYCSREFHSFKKAHVETNIEFNDAESDSNPLHENVKSKTQYDMKTPVPPKEETPPSKKEH